MNKIDKIITFSCSKAIHVYWEGCSESPRQPYRFHEDIEQAERHLVARGVDCPKVVEYKASGKLPTKVWGNFKSARFDISKPPRAPGGTWIEREEHRLMLILERDLRSLDSIFGKSFKRNLTYGCGEAFHIDEKGNIKDLLDDSR